MFLSILAAVTGLLPSLINIGGKIADYKTAQLNASTDKEKASIEAGIQALHDRRDVLVAEAGNRLAAGINASVRLLLALGPILYVLKYYAWDKVVGAFKGCTGDAARDLLHCATYRTDGLNTEMAAVLIAVLGFYLLHTWKK